MTEKMALIVIIGNRNTSSKSSKPGKHQRQKQISKLDELNE